MKGLLQTADYRERAVAGDEARAWLAANPSACWGKGGRDRARYRAQNAVDDGWALVLSSWVARPGDEGCSRVACPTCGQQYKLGQVTWRGRHERKHPDMPTQMRVARWVGDAFAVLVDLELAWPRILGGNLRALGIVARRAPWSAGRAA